MSDADSPDFWDKLYSSNSFPWDLGGPTPVFEQLIGQNHFEPGQMLVLGAGRGHDARLFARHKFRVTAVDFSVEAVEAMKQLDVPQHPVEIVHSDFFSLPEKWSDRFDYVLDYTSFCAILPQRRPEYADLVTRLLKSKGKLIMLAFPIGNRTGGPPFVVQPDAIIDLFAYRGFTLQVRESPIASVPARKGYEELLILEKS